MMHTIRASKHCPLTACAVRVQIRNPEKVTPESSVSIPEFGRELRMRARQEPLSAGKTYFFGISASRSICSPIFSPICNLHLGMFPCQCLCFSTLLNNVVVVGVRQSYKQLKVATSK
ncbi:hypothetical protein L596_009552 [Steinernema carpocapsae]|uniref:Uncharacterized protein n=1 Tax=Steinernema carpocapsae TaxID=34508 RepID=A0A4U5PG73_STECR|nr:hypothetical protein L596_009552 [Steinernema carpocapsae]